jgi:hypothetical protein
LLKPEDDLHLDLSTLSFRFVFAPPGPPKPAAALESYIANGAGTVQGVKDHEKQIQIEFWQRAAREGFTDAQARASALKFRAEFDALDKTLAKQPYLMGRPLERARHRVVDLRAPALAGWLSVRAATSTCFTLGPRDFAPCRSLPRRSRSFAIPPNGSTPSVACNLVTR